MSERLKLRGALEEKRLKAQDLAVRAAGIIRAMRDLTLPAAVTPLAEIDSAQILQLAAMLHEIRTNYISLASDIEELKRELG